MQVIVAYAADIPGFPGKLVALIYVQNVKVLYGMCPKEEKRRLNRKTCVSRSFWGN